MKIRRALSVFLAIIMLTGCLSTMPVSAQTAKSAATIVKEVYVAASTATPAGGSDTEGDGTTEKPYETINKAIAAINGSSGVTHGKIFLMSDIKIVLSDWNFTQSECKVPLTITSYTTSADTAKKALDINSSAGTGRPYSILSETTFDNMIIKSTGAVTAVNANGRKLTVNENVEVLDKDTTTGIKGTYLYGARNNADGIDVTVRGGNWAIIYPINSEPYATIGDASTTSTNVFNFTFGGNATAKYIYLCVHKQTDGEPASTAFQKDALVVNGKLNISIEDNAKVTNFIFTNGIVASSSGTVTKRATTRATFNGEVTISFKGDCKRLDNDKVINIYAPDAAAYKSWYQVGGSDTSSSFSTTLAEDKAARMWFKEGITLDMSDFIGDNANNTRELVRAKFRNLVGTQATTNNGIIGLVYKEHIMCVGVQTQTGVTEGNTDKYNVRFIAVLDRLDYDEAGFDIVVKQSDKGIKSFNKSTDTVYTSILANNNAGIASEISATELGGEYIIALTITGIPTNLGELVFEITPFTTGADGKMCGATESFKYLLASTSN